MLPKHPLVTTATAVAAARHSPPPQPQSLRGFIVVVVVMVIIIVIVIITGDDLFDCCVCSVIVSSPLPHPVVAIPPTTASAIVWPSPLSLSSLSSPTTPLSPSPSSPAEDQRAEAACGRGPRRQALDCLRRCDGGWRQRWLAVAVGGAAMAHRIDIIGSF